MTTRQWISLAVNLVVVNIMLAIFEVGILNHGSVNLKAVLTGFILTGVLQFIAFQALGFAARGIWVVIAAALFAILMPAAGLAILALLNKGDIFAWFIVGAKAWKFILPLFLINCGLMYWATRERRTNR